VSLVREPSQPGPVQVTTLTRELITPRMLLTLGIVEDAKAIIDRCRNVLASGAMHLSFGPPVGAI
jgi:hypothetical protein